jgi:hypothetical protein
MAGERTSMPTLMPEIYALARCGHFPVKSRARISSTNIEVTMASAVFV